MARQRHDSWARRLYLTLLASLGVEWSLLARDGMEAAPLALLAFAIALRIAGTVEIEIESRNDGQEIRQKVPTVLDTLQGGSRRNLIVWRVSDAGSPLHRTRRPILNYPGTEAWTANKRRTRCDRLTAGIVQCTRKGLIRHGTQCQAFPLIDRVQP